MANVIEFDRGPEVLASEAMTYRLRASKLGRMAHAESDITKMLLLLHEALAWIELAANEELLATCDAPQHFQ
jgi:hypothetical protein